MLTDFKTLLERFKSLYLNKELILTKGTYHIVKIFAMGYPGAEFFNFVYDKVEYKLINDGDDFDDEVSQSLEQEAEEHFVKYFGKGVVTAFSSKEEYTCWIEQYFQRVPKHLQQIIHE
jgi:hypothetical protein